METILPILLIILVAILTAIGILMALDWVKDLFRRQ